MFHFHSDSFQKGGHRWSADGFTSAQTHTCFTCCNYLRPQLWSFSCDRAGWESVECRHVLSCEQVSTLKTVSFGVSTNLHFLFLSQIRKMPLLLKQSRSEQTETVFQRSSVSLHKVKKSQQFKCHVQTFPHVSRVNCREGWHIKSSGLAMHCC